MAAVRFRPEVVNDLRETIDWYDSKRAGLGNEFADEFWNAIENVTAQPLGYALTSTGLRACRLSRFPYVVHYRTNQQEILIVAVMFGGRDPSAWNDRI
ncbi:MAG: type II toxin-antitoxin system RelE/ParE family toxin [Aureliella sp.]